MFTRLRRLLFCIVIGGLASQLFAAEPGAVFPDALVKFKAYSDNPVFVSGKKGDWDARIRERGWILKDKGGYRMWYTGFNPEASEGLTMKLGYATSADGIHWKRSPHNPIYEKHWVEDMMVIPYQGKYYMFAEGRGDLAQLLESSDGIHWTRQGQLDVRTTKGQPIKAGPYGTPTGYLEDGVWYLFYERRDLGVWLATSKDRKVWTNVEDEPVLKLGPGDYDSEQIALNQIIKYKGRYYAYYHGSGHTSKPRLWCPAIATSTDLIHWQKYPGNPLRPMKENRSSGIVIPEGDQFRFYTMHDKVDLFLPKEKTQNSK